MDASRRRFLGRMVAAGGLPALAACLRAERGDDPAGDSGDGHGDGTAAETDGPGPPAAQPSSQFAWNDHLERSGPADVPVLPHHHLVLTLSYDGPGRTPGDDARQRFEAALGAVEGAHAWGPGALLFTVGYTPAYFDRFDEDLPPSARLGDPAELPPSNDAAVYPGDVAIHLASDRASAILAVEEALFGDLDGLPDGTAVPPLDGVLAVEERLTGFYLLDDYAIDGTLEGVFDETVMRDMDLDLPDYVQVSEEAPFFMAPPSAKYQNKASEARVTIREGPFAGGTTQHVESLALDLEAWSETSAERRRRLTWTAGSTERSAGSLEEQRARGEPGYAEAHAREHGMVGHAEKLAAARDDDGGPPVLRREFATLDLPRPGLHFLTLHRSMDDYRRARRIMQGERFAGRYPGIGDERNNGLLAFIEPVARGTYLLPPRRRRSFPRPAPP